MFQQELWAEVTPESFMLDMEVKPLGAGSVATKELKLRQLFEWMSIVGQNPEMSQAVDWKQVLEHLTFIMLPDESAFFMKQEQPQVAQDPMGGDPMAQVQKALQATGGGADIRALQSQAAAGTLPQTIEKLTTQL